MEKNIRNRIDKRMQNILEGRQQTRQRLGKDQCA